MSGSRPARFPAAAWFGSQIGVTAWLLAMAIVYGARDRALGFALFVVFALVNVAGAFIFCAPKHLGTIARLWLLLGIATLGGAGALAMLEAAGQSQDLIEHWAFGLKPEIWLLVFPVVGIALSIGLRRRAR